MSAGTPGQRGSLVEIGSDHCGVREQQRAERSDCRLIDQPIPMLADAHWVDDQWHWRIKISHEICDAGNSLLTAEHPDLHRIHADVIDNTPKLCPDRLLRQRPDALHTD